MQNPTRRRVLAAGFTGTVLGLVGGASRDRPARPHPTRRGDDDVAARVRPTAEDIALLGFAQSFELTARDLYQAAHRRRRRRPTGDRARATTTSAYAEVLAGILGIERPGNAAIDGAVRGPRRRLRADRPRRPRRARLRPRVDRRRHAHRPARPARRHRRRPPASPSILIVEARQCAVLADIAGLGDDFDALFVNDARPLRRRPSRAEADDDDRPTPIATTGIGRRQLLQAGGLTVALGALVAACGEREAEERARDGSATPRRPPPLPTVEVNDVVYLRTATSIEQTARRDVRHDHRQRRAVAARPPDDARPADRGPPGCRRGDRRADRPAPAASRTSAPTPGTWSASSAASSTTSPATRPRTSSRATIPTATCSP